MVPGIPVTKKQFFLQEKNKVLDLLLEANSKFIYESYGNTDERRNSIIYRQCEKSHTVRSANERVPVAGSLCILATGNLGSVKSKSEKSYSDLEAK